MLLLNASKVTYICLQKYIYLQLYLMFSLLKNYKAMLDDYQYVDLVGNIMEIFPSVNIKEKFLLKHFECPVIFRPT